MLPGSLILSLITTKRHSSSIVVLNAVYWIPRPRTRVDWKDVPECTLLVNLFLRPWRPFRSWILALLNCDMLRHGASPIHPQRLREGLRCSISSSPGTLRSIPQARIERGPAFPASWLHKDDNLDESA